MINVNDVMNLEVNENFIREIFPEFRHSEIKTINEGSENWVFKVNYNLILKIPRDKKCNAKIQNEILFIDQAGEILKPLLPEFLRFEQSLLPIYIYQKLNGNSFFNDFKCPNIRNEIAKQLGYFFSNLHDIENKNKFQDSIKTQQLNIEEFSQLSIQYKGLILEKLLKKDRSQFLKFYDISWKKIFMRSLEELRLCHNDIKGEHVILDNESKRIIGIIDWADIRITEVYKDFAGVIIWQNREILQEIPMNYPCNGIDKKREFISARYYAIHNSIINLGKTIGREWEAPKELIIRQFQNATKLRYGD